MSSGADDPVVIVGGGLMGSAAAWALTRRGVPVVLVEQFALGHRHGGSHGSARIVRRAYGDALYAGLTGRAFELWRELELAAGASVLRAYGALDFGPGREVATVARLLAETEVAHEVLPAAEAQARWPGMRFDGDVVFHPQAGTLDADAAVTAMLALATRAGATVRAQTTATAVDPSGVTLADGTRVAARAVVVAAGGWVAPLLDGQVELPPIRVTAQSVFHFPRHEPAQEPWPSTIHEFVGTAVYHLAGGRDGGAQDDRKVGVHDPGPVIVPDGRPREIDPAARTSLIDYVREWLPGLDPTPRTESTCLYTSTPTEDFLLDAITDDARADGTLAGTGRETSSGTLVICSPCSGHGAKFAPLIGEYVAGMITGATGTGSAAGPRDGLAAGPDAVPDRFRLAAHRRARATHVSL